VTFVPCFLWILVGAPYVERLRENRSLAAALSAITAAVVGVILNLALWFGMHFIFRTVGTTSIGPLRLDLPILSSIDPAAALLSATALVAILRFKLAMPLVIAACAAAGIILKSLL
jgi:chromate transporter